MNAADPGTASAAPANERAPRPSLPIAALHLGVLWAFAFQKPLFDLLGRNADFFAVRGNTRVDILTFAICFTLLPPLALVAIEWLALRIRPRLQAALHLLFVALLAAAVLLQFLKDNVATGPAGMLIAIALALGLGLALVYARTAFLPQALSVLSPAPLLFLAIFLLFSPVHKLILPQKAVAASDVSVSSRTPIVMLLFDELPVTTLMNARHEVDAGRYPHFAELAAHSTWFRNATTIASYTTRATPAIMDGEDPRGRLPVASDQPHSIFTLLGRSYRMNVDETATSVCSASICHRPGGGRDVTVGAAASGRSNGRFRTRMRQLVSDLRIVSEHLLLPDALAAKLPPVDETFGGFGNGEQAGGDGQGAGGVAVQQLNETVRPGAFTNRDETFARFVDSVDGAAKTLNLIHIEIPHVPWVYLPDGREYETHAPDLPLHHGLWAASQYAVDYAYLRHLLQVGFADKLLGDLIARMKKVGLWDRAIFVVTADHGVSFIADSQRRDPSTANLGNIAHVPLFFKAPGQSASRVEDGHRCTTDILPMIARILQVKIPWPGYRCTDTVSVSKFDATPLTLPLAELLRKRETALRRMLGLFGSGDWPQAYRFGPHPELVGEQVSALPWAAAGSARVSLEDDFEAVDPSAKRLPVIVQGTARGVPSGAPLAIAVNGRIEAVAESFVYMGATRVAATIPPNTLRRGRNSVEVLEVSGSAAAPSLRSLGGVNASR
ncbi:MAG: hypothetical protein QOG09_1528 [Solirubrobacterales bacterium]|nr:hypothetical protein [Solirubrobacterales bacterium]